MGDDGENRSEQDKKVRGDFMTMVRLDIVWQV